MGIPAKIGEFTWSVIAEIGLVEAFSAKDADGKRLFETYKKLYGYYDLFLINPNGYCFYTVCKESDYQSNFVKGKYSNSNLGKLIRKVLETKQFEISDFESYAPSNNEPAAFVAQPLLHKGDIEIIIALQLPAEVINKIMEHNSGMSDKEETYLVGSDYLMRSDSFINPTKHSFKASFANMLTGSVT